MPIITDVHEACIRRWYSFWMRTFVTDGPAHVFHVLLICRLFPKFTFSLRFICFLLLRQFGKSFLILWSPHSTLCRTKQEKEGKCLMNGDCLSEPLLLSLISKWWRLSYKLLFLFTGTKILYNIVLYKAWKETRTFSIET